MGIESATYVLNHNISVVLPCFITLSQLLLKQIRNYDGRVTLVRKIQNIEYSFSQNILLSCVCRTLSIISTAYERMSSFKLEGYSDRANCFGSLGR